MHDMKHSVSSMVSTADVQALMKTIVFSGPSISEAEVRNLAAVTHAPPVKRGDLGAINDYDVIVILDGEFGQSISVSPKEILAVLERGKTVIGASSMGALRASELDRSGMIGVGWVYDYFRRSAVRRDADVALVYAPFDFQPMTVPMVDVEYWMEQASAAGLIPARERTLVLKAARKIFFADRTGDRLTESLRRAVGIDMLEALLASSGGTIPSVKSIDAAKAVRLSVSLAERRRPSHTEAG
jgi:TfuA protein